MIKITNSKSNIVLKNFFNPRFYRGFFRLKSLAIAGLLSLTLSFYACNDMDEIGLDLIDTPLQSDLDTLPLVAYTQIEDSLLTHNTDISLLGFINDPVFGKTSAELYTEVLPRSLPPTIPDIPSDSLRIDSVVLSMAYNGYYGDITQTHHVRVFELDEGIPADSIWSNRQLAAGNEILVENSAFLPLPGDTLYLGEDSARVPPQLRLRLDTELGRRFFNDRDSISEMTINDDFRNYLKGFVLKMEEPDQPGSMLYFNLSNSQSKLTVYYAEIEDEDNQNLEFLMNDPLARRFNHYQNFDYEFADQNIKAQIFEGDTLQGDSLLFVQSMSNFRVKILMPSVQNFMDEMQGDIAINQAKLIIPVDDDYIQDTLELARFLYLFREDPQEPGVLISLDDQFVGQEYFGGELDADKREYSFNVTRHFQGILNDDFANTPLYLRVSGSAQNAGRAVLKGTGRDNPLRLEIQYTQPNTD